MVHVMTTDDFNWNEVENFAGAFVNMKHVHNARSNIPNQYKPLEQNFETLGAFKENVIYRSIFAARRKRYLSPYLGHTETLLEPAK